MFILHEWLTQQQAWSKETFGPGPRTEGVLDHISKEMEEVRAHPHSLEEWIDIAILAFDGAYRMGYTPGEITAALRDKQEKNFNRKWPDWRTQPHGKAIEHIREND